MSDAANGMIQVSVMAAQDPATGHYTAIPLYARWEDLLGFSATARDYITEGLQERAEKGDHHEGD